MNVTHLGQVFTSPEVVDRMLALRQSFRRCLEPSCGDGAFFNRIRQATPDCVGIELDSRVAPPGAKVMDFFDYPLSEKFDSIIGNPPYVRYQDIPLATKHRLTSSLFDKRSNLYLFFIEKAVQHLVLGGELIFIVPRDFIKLTSAQKLNTWLLQEGSFTHFEETGDSAIFGKYTPNCVIFRYVRGLHSDTLADGRRLRVREGHLVFDALDAGRALSELFSVRVGGVSGADTLFEHPEGNRAFVCSKTRETGETRQMIYNEAHPALLPFKDQLLARKIRSFDETTWWQWGRKCPESTAPRIYVNGRTRRADPFFLHPATAFDGSILALFPSEAALKEASLQAWRDRLNAVDWAEQGFVCDGRLLFTQRSLQAARLPG